MSDRDDHSVEAPADERASDSYAVGYRRPPLHSRFQKGQSGNPQGRPKGAKAKSRAPLAQERLKTIILDEAYRSVEIQDRGETISLPVAQLAMRSLATKAAKGDHRSQRLIAELVGEIERQDRELNLRSYETAITYKREWTEAIERSKRNGFPEPTPLPHPEDIMINARTGEVTYAGPLCEQEKAALDKARSIYISLIEDLEAFERRAKNARTEVRRAEWQGWYEKTLAEFEQFSARMEPLAEKWPRHWPPR